MGSLTISGYPTALLEAISDSLVTVAADCAKIDSAAADGLAGTPDSLAYITQETERHFHSYESWFGLASVPVGEVHRADRLGVGVAPFVIDAANNDWGAWLQILGSADTPARAGDVKFDLHRLVFTNAERNAPYFLQIAYGASGDAGYNAGAFTEVVFVPASNQIDSGPVDIQCRRHDVGTLAWARTLCPGEDTGTLSFYHGSHGYEG
jgi:hypothetical protein